MISLGECVEKRLLMKTAPSRSQADKSMLKARQFLDGAEKALVARSWDICVLGAYAAAFNAALALLERDGWREKSHACVPRYLEKQYPALDWRGLDKYREMRHTGHYSPDYLATEEDARDITTFAKRFIAEVKKLLK